jgi:hypothetical protein
MLQTRVAAIFVFISFTSLLSIAGVPALLKEIKVILIAIYIYIYKNQFVFDMHAIKRSSF